MKNSFRKGEKVQKRKYLLSTSGGEISACTYIVNCTVNDTYCPEKQTKICAWSKKDPRFIENIPPDNINFILAN